MISHNDVLFLVMVVCARELECAVWGQLYWICAETFLNEFVQWRVSMKTVGGDKVIIVRLVMGNKAFSCLL